MNETSNLVGYYETGRKSGGSSVESGKMDPCRNIGEIPEQLEIQGKKLKVLSELLDILCTKLAPIRCTRPTDNMEENDYPIDTSLISKVLQQNNKNLQNIINGIVNVTDEIQL